MTDRPAGRRQRARVAPGAAIRPASPLNGHRPRAAVPTSLVQPPLNGKLVPAAEPVDPQRRRRRRSVAEAPLAAVHQTPPAKATSASKSAKAAPASTSAKAAPASKPVKAAASNPLDAAPRSKSVQAKASASATPAPRKAAKSAQATSTPRKAAKTTAADSVRVRSTSAKAGPAKADGATVTRAAGGRPPDVWDERVAAALGFLRRRLTGQYEVDEFGFDPQFTELLIHPLLRLLYQRYFRVEASGVENLPDGPALLVANHSGTVPMDALMLSMAVHDETPPRRHLRLLAADLVFRIPVLSELARKAGSTLACNPDAERLMRAGEYVGVFPEGFKGIGKPYRDRYKLQRFGRGGFVAAALKTSTPIVPVSIVGAEEIYPIMANVKPLAQVTGLPYAPVTPLFPWLGPLGMLPLPSKWLIEFGTPIPTDQYAEDADDPIVVFNLADQVRETIQQTLLTLLERRPDPFS